MNLQTELFGNVLVIHTPEELSVEQTERFETFMAGVDAQRVVLDIDHTETLDSGGLTSILAAQEKLQAEGGDLKIATTNVINRKILEITRLDQHLEVFESLVDAVNSFQ